MGLGSLAQISEAADKADRFRGKVVIDETVEDTFNEGKSRWHFGVQPEGTDKVIQGWYRPGPRGQMAQMSKALIAAGVPKTVELGDGKLLELDGEWERKPFMYKDRESGEMKEGSSPNIILHRSFGIGAARPAFDYDDVVNMLTVLDGKKSSEYQRGIMKDPLLSNAAKVGILSGDAQKWLVSEGYAVLDGDILHSTEKALDLAER